jgi:hypothetical protein
VTGQKCIVVFIYLIGFSDGFLTWIVFNYQEINRTTEELRLEVRL